MCLSGSDYVQAKVTQRLIERGVPVGRAQAVGMKVARRYRSRLLAAQEALWRASELDAEILSETRSERETLREMGQPELVDDDASDLWERQL